MTFFPVAVGRSRASPDAVVATTFLRQHGRVAPAAVPAGPVAQAMPSFFTALRIGIIYAVTGAIFAEYVGATAGLAST